MVSWSHGLSQGFAERFPETVKNAEAKTPKEFTKIRAFTLFSA